MDVPVQVEKLGVEEPYNLEVIQGEHLLQSEKVYVIC
jgi:hypothetical protein